MSGYAIIIVATVSCHDILLSFYVRIIDELSKQYVISEEA